MRRRAGNNTQFYLTAAMGRKHPLDWRKLTNKRSARIPDALLGWGED